MCDWSGGEFQLSMGSACVMCVSGEKKVSQWDQANPTWATQMVCGWQDCDDSMCNDWANDDSMCNDWANDKAVSNALVPHPVPNLPVSLTDPHCRFDSIRV